MCCSNKICIYQQISELYRPTGLLPSGWRILRKYTLVFCSLCRCHHSHDILMMQLPIIYSSNSSKSTSSSKFTAKSIAPSCPTTTFPAGTSSGGAQKRTGSGGANSGAILALLYDLVFRTSEDL